MGLRSFIGGLVNRGESDPIDPRRGQTFFVGNPWLPDGLRLSPHQAFEVSTVFACCSIISGSIAAAPWEVYTLDIDGKRQKLANDPLYWLLNVAPNPEQIAQSAKESLIWQALIWGDAYAEVVRDGSQRVAEIWPMLTEYMLPPTRDKDGVLIYEYRNPDGGVIQLPASRVYHLRGPSIDGLMGVGTVSTAMKAIATAAAQDRYASAYFANAATPSGILTSPKVLQPKDRMAIKAELQANKTGARNAGAWMVLEGGLDWKPVSNSPGESQMSEARERSVEDIARYFGIPLHLLASAKGAQGYGTNISQLGHSLINFGLRNWVRRMEQEAQVKLIGARTPKMTCIDLSQLSKGTEKEQAEADEIRIRSGVLTINEARERAGMNHGPDDLDEHFIQTAWQPVEKALAPDPEPVVAGPSDSAEGDAPAAPGADAGSQDTAREAMAVLYQGALARHAGRVANGTKPEASFAKLESECLAASAFLSRAKLTGPNGALTKSAEAVLAGQPADVASVFLANSLEAITP